MALARRIAGHRSLRFAGIQAYWGNLQQVMPLEEREKRARRSGMESARALVAALRRRGPQAAGSSRGSGTGTHWLDAQHGVFTELQPGSFLFLDSCYVEVAGDARKATRSRPSLFVAASVVTSNRPGRVIVNAGCKAFATD